MKRIRSLAIGNMIVFFVQLAFSWLTQSKLVNSLDVGEVSDRYYSLFTPAGLTFAIWGLIYFFLLLFCIRHLVIAYRFPANHEANKDLLKIGGLFIVNNLLTAAWLVAWTREDLSASMLLIVFQLVTLIIVFSRLGIFNRLASTGSRMFTQLPLSIYFAWITVATIANAAIYLSAAGWDGMGISAVDWTIIMIGVSIVISALVVLTRNNIFYGLVFIWAFYGIIVKHTGDHANSYPGIVLAAETGMILIGVLCVLQLARALSWKKPHQLFPLAPHSLK